jgi:hypothetical protein
MFHPRWLVTALALCAVAFLGTSLVLGAQDSSSPAPDAEKQKLQDEKDKADLKKTIAQDNQAVAEANAAATKATIGGISTDKLPQGTLTPDEKMTIEGTILAYKTASASSDGFVDLVAPTSGGSRSCPMKITLYSSKEFNDGWAAATLVSQMEIIAAQGQVLNTDLVFVQEAVEAPRVAPAAIFAGIDAAVSLISLFKTDTTIKAVAITGDDSALQAALSGALMKACPNLKLLNPSYYQGAILPATQNGSLLYELDRLGKLSIALQARAADLEATAKVQENSRLDELRSQIDNSKKDLSAADDQISALREKIANATGSAKQKLQRDLAAALDARSKLERQVNTLTAARRVHEYNLSLINTRQESIKSFVDGWLKLNGDLGKADDSGLTVLQRMLRAESFRREITDSNILAAKFVSAGGNIITSKNIFRTSLSFSGGSIVQLQYLDNNGAVKAAALLSNYGGRVREKDLPTGHP